MEMTSSKWRHAAPIVHGGMLVTVEGDEARTHLLRMWWNAGGATEEDRQESIDLDPACGIKGAIQISNRVKALKLCQRCVKGLID